MFKPTFGQPTSNTGFGGFSTTANTSPFGQTSMFGKTTTSGFGTQPAFGQTTSSGLFGNTMPSSSSGLFGATSTAPSFGQPQTNQPSFGFGATSQPSANLFGSQPTTGAGLFGTNTSAFGQNKPAFGSTFGSTTTGLFGAQQPAQGSTPLFGQNTAATGSGLFGASTGGFGQPTQTSGTTIKFNPITGTDTMIKGGVSQTINTRHFCITCMKEYENKSLEELRWEDYQANRKGPQAGAAQPLFGQTQQQTPLFGTNTGSSGLFGQPTTTQPLFGSSLSSGFGGSNTGTFGATATTSNSLFGSKPTGFGATTTTSSGFNFGNTPNTNLFGAAQNKSPFGATTQSGLFGQTNTQPTTGFGTTTTSGFGSFGAPQNQSIGLFGQNKPATTFNLGGQSSSGGFAFGSNTATNTGQNLFGKPTTSGFGSTTPAFGTANTGFGTTTGFGTPATQANSLFKPSTTGFGFGTTPSTSTGLGSSTGFGTGSTMFSNTAAKPGGLFGNTTSGGGLFGSSTGGFGTSGTNFGGIGGNSFGNSSLLGGSPSANTSSSPHPAILALTSVPFSDSPLFKNLLPASGKTDALLKPNLVLFQKGIQTAKEHHVASKTNSKIKLKPLYAPLTKKSLFEGLDESETNITTSANTTNPKRLYLKSKQKLNSTWVNNLSDKENYSEIHESPKQVRESYSNAHESPTHVRESYSNAHESPTHVKEKYVESPTHVKEKYVESPKRVTFSEDVTYDTERLNLLVPSEKGSSDGFHIRRNPLFKPIRKSTSLEITELNNTEEEVTSQQEVHSKTNETTASDSEVVNSLDETRTFMGDTTILLEDWQPHPTGIINRRAGYYTIPTLDELECLIAEDGSCVVDNFSIGREDYGNLYFNETMDVAGLNIDEIVHFRHKEITVYPNDDKKPPVGFGLNRKCQVTLNHVWPIDKTTREPVKDRMRLISLGYEDKLKRKCTRMGARFIEYRPEDGAWVFKVDHFSKYGITDSDEDDDMAALPPVVQLPVKPPVAVVTKPQQTLITPPGLVMRSPINQNTRVIEKPFEQDLYEDMNDEDDDLGESVSDTDGDFSQLMSPRSGIDSHRVQLMKASLFDDMDLDDEFKEIDEYGELAEQIPRLQLIGHKSFSSYRSKSKLEDAASQNFYLPKVDEVLRPAMAVEHLPTTQPPIFLPRPKGVSVTMSRCLLPYAESIMSRLPNRCISDISLFKGRSYRVGWMKGNQLIHLQTSRKAGQLSSLPELLDGRGSDDKSPPALQTLALFNEYFRHNGLFEESITGHLDIQLEHSIKGEQDGCPIISPMPGTEALHAHCLYAVEQSADHDDEFLLYCQRIWQLCVALWGSLPTLSDNEGPTSHDTALIRREAVTEWLQKYNYESAEERVKTLLAETKSKNSHVPASLLLLSAKQVDQACSTLQDKGDNFAALVVVSSESSKPFIQKLLAEWQDVDVDRFINEDRLKLYTLSSGLPLFPSSQGLINICQDLDWKQAFAIHFWYLCSPIASISDALEKYEAAFDGTEAYATRPYPPYCEHLETVQGRHIYDICFYLLKLYSTKSSSLDQLLNPATYTSDPLDYRLSWLLDQTLKSLGYSHHSSSSSSTVCASFAAQLEAHGLWQWAVFVYLHIDNAISRRKCVEELLGRHVKLTEERHLTTEEVFVVDQLHVPAEWVYQAKAVLALSLRNYHDSAYYLIQAGNWNDAHDVVVQYLASDAVINENYDYLKQLLEQISVNSYNISKWNQLGQILYDYLEVVHFVQLALVNRDTYELERRQAQITRICVDIPSWPCHSAKDRLCQAAIAKGIAHIFHTITMLQKRMSYREIKETIKRLPLPEDYLMEELRHLKEDCHKK